MVNDFIEGLGKGMIVLVILTLVGVLGYATGEVLGFSNPQVPAIGFVASCVVVGVVNVIRVKGRLL